MAVAASEMVSLILTALQANPVGVLSITVDGQTVQYSRTQALEELKFWEKRALRESGLRPRVASIDLSKGFNGRISQ